MESFAVIVKALRLESREVREDNERRPASIVTDKP